MRNLLLAAALAAAAMAAPAAAVAQSPSETSAASSAAAPAPSAQAGQPDDPNRLVCKRERITGTNRREKVCMTVAERDRLRDAAVARTQNNRGADYNKCIGGPGR